MIQDIFPHVFHNEFHERSSLPGDLVTVLAGGKTYLTPSGTFPTAAEVKALGVEEGDLVYLFEIDQTAFFLSLPDDTGCRKSGFGGAWDRGVPQHEAHLSGPGRGHGPASVRLVPR